MSINKKDLERLKKKIQKIDKAKKDFDERYNKEKGEIIDLIDESMKSDAGNGKSSKRRTSVRRNRELRNKDDSEEED